MSGQARRFEYLCLRCREVFYIARDPAKGLGDVCCPKCAHVYLEWLNYDERKAG